MPPRRPEHGGTCADIGSTPCPTEEKEPLGTAIFASCRRAALDAA
jgi:hypothetical protein